VNITTKYSTTHLPGATLVNIIRYLNLLPIVIMMWRKEGERSG
jgi:hypothetical protein